MPIYRKHGLQHGMLLQKNNRRFELKKNYGCSQDKVYVSLDTKKICIIESIRTGRNADFIHMPSNFKGLSNLVESSQCFYNEIEWLSFY
jgi:hypothetical protein